MSLVEATKMIVETFGTEPGDAIAMLATRTEDGRYRDNVRNLNHATKIWLDAGEGTYRTDELQAFLECFGATSKSSASNRATMQRSAQSGANKYKVAEEDVCSYPVANQRTGRVRARMASSDEAEALDALLSQPKPKASKAKAKSAE